jgi:hypothetical protein
MKNTQDINVIACDNIGYSVMSIGANENIAVISRNITSLFKNRTGTILANH